MSLTTVHWARRIFPHSLNLSESGTIDLTDMLSFATSSICNNNPTSCVLVDNSVFGQLSLLAYRNYGPINQRLSLLNCGTLFHLVPSSATLSLLMSEIECKHLTKTRELSHSPDSMGSSHPSLDRQMSCSMIWRKLHKIQVDSEARIFSLQRDVPVF